VTPTITWANPAPITYGTPLGPTQLNATASMEGRRVEGAFTYSPPAETVLNGGNQTLSVTFTPADTRGGLIHSAEATATINVQKATPKITWANPAPIINGMPLGATQLNATASWTVLGSSVSVPGNFNYSPPAGTVLPVGNNQTLSVTFTPTDTADYTTASATATINVTVMPQPIVNTIYLPEVAAITGINNFPPPPGVLGGVEAGIGVMGSSDAGIGILGGSNSGTGVFGTSNSGTGVEGQSTSGTAVTGGSTSGRGVWGVSNSGTGVLGESTSFDAVVGETSSDAHAGVTGHNLTAGGNGGVGVHGIGGIFAGKFDGNVLVNGALTTMGNAQLGGDVHVTGTHTVDKDIILTGAGDCAERFDVQADAAIEPGTVMVLDEDELLRVCERGYDRKVAGVISGAGDLRAGLILAGYKDGNDSAHNSLPLALVGKVYCKVDAQYGPIDVGDLLTTSSTPGHAMKAGDPVQAFGAVIGKALRPLKSGQGLVPILVALQ